MNLEVFIKNIKRCQFSRGVCCGFWLTCFPWKISPFSFPMGCDVIFEHLVFLSRPSSSIHFHLRTARTSTHFELSISLSLSLSLSNSHAHRKASYMYGSSSGKQAIYRSANGLWDKNRLPNKKKKAIFYDWW